MICSFGNKTAEDIFHGTNSRFARKLPKILHNKARRQLDQINAAFILDDLSRPPGNRLEALRGDRKGQHSIRINDQWRICFRWMDSGVFDVEIVDYH